MASCPICDEGDMFVWYYEEDEGTDISFRECDTCGFRESR